ncbi:MAG: ferrous iron transport protein A [Clostridiaceae bacterium]|nr:ferrous iron transport protein A [Clostridiaceae bacterium]
MKNVKDLSKVELNKEVKVKKINCNGNIKRRILELGMIEGTKIKPVLKSPLGDPTAYEVRGSIISLREEDSKNIEIV